MPRKRRVWRCLPTLWRQELRFLRNHVTTWMVLGLILITAALPRLSGQGDVRPASVCYILYWQDDAWAKTLKEEAARLDPKEGLRIVVAPVTQFTNAEGMITYPQDVHSSIQVRPPEGDRKSWLIYYWHIGPDPNILWPYARWFERVTRRHFGQQPDWEEMVKPLQAVYSTPLGSIRTHTLSGDNPMEIQQVGVLWLAIFYVACCLPMLSLSQDREHGTLLSLAITPAGWDGPAVAKAVFYAGMAAGFAALTALVAGGSWLFSPWFWLAVATGAIAYVGVALVITSLCRSVASATAGLVVYGLASGTIFYIGLRLQTVWYPFRYLGYAILDLNLLTLLAQIGGLTAAEAKQPQAIALVALAFAWAVLGAVCYRRARYS